MSHFATGITVVSTHFEGQNVGMTCNSFSTVSLDPALVLWSIRKESHSHIAFTHSGGYMVSVLAKQQQHVAMQFTHGTQEERFHNVDLEHCAASSNPRIANAVAWFDCKLEQIVTAGDHDILIGRVLEFGSHEGEALIYSQRHFGTFKPF
jgi:3-hydroxy-9,10-secoandrosta-1,3,5(10)-triene-9,17-dione monooxygenase reductase component